MTETAKKSTTKDWPQFFLAKNPSLSAAGKMGLERALSRLQSDGVDIDSLCRGVAGLKNLPNEKRSTILSRYSAADQRRIKALPKTLRAIALMLKKKGFDFFVRWGAQRCPGLINSDELFPLRDGDRGNFLLKLPEILEDVAQAIEKTLQHPPKSVTFAMRLTRIVDKVEAESRSSREHYQEVLDILDPEGHSQYTYDGLKNLVARQKRRYRPSR
jgi:hypothetical protein